MIFFADINNIAYANASGNAGSIQINTNNLEIFSSGIKTANAGRGNADNIIFKANNILIDGGASISSQIEQGGQGNAGNVEINSNNLTVNSSFIISDIGRSTPENKSIGNAGNVTINVTEDFVLNGGLDGSLSIVSTQIQDTGNGNTGDVTINAGSLFLNNKAFILADNNGGGSAGNITINAMKEVALDGSEQIEENGNRFVTLIISQIQKNGNGTGGDINISAPTISLTNFSLISTNAKEGGVGNAGNIFLDANTIKISEGSVVDALTENNFDAGDININADSLELINGGKIVTASGGNAGNINLNITDKIILDNKNPPSNAPFEEEVLQKLAFETGLFADTINNSTGDGGNINISTGSIQLDNNSTISAVTTSGTGGNINLQIDDSLSLGKNSLISTEASGLGDGGNINIDAQFIVSTPNQNSDILANAEEGDGGNITISTEALFGIQERTQNSTTNDIDASSDFGLTGTVSITNPDINPLQGATELPTTVIEPEQTTAQACASNRDNVAQNRLTINGKGGIPAAPTEPLVAEPILLNGQYSEIKPIKTSIGDIYPARGVTVTKTGEVILTAYPTDNFDSRSFNGAINCGKT